MSHFDQSNFGGLEMYDGDGGFLNNTQGANKKEKRAQNIVPITIHQINKADDQDLSIFGLSVNLIRVVGILKTYVVESTRALYDIEDVTGSIQCVMYIEDDKTVLPEVKNGNYVEVIGTIRSQGGQRKLMVLRVLPVDDCNIITNHYLNAAYVNLQAEAESKGVAAADSTNPVAGASTTWMGNDSAANNPFGFTDLQFKIFHKIDSIEGSVGIKKDELYRQFAKGSVTQRNIDEILDLLTNEGHVFGTLNSDYYTSTTKLNM